MKDRPLGVCGSFITVSLEVGGRDMSRRLRIEASSDKELTDKGKELVEVIEGAEGRWKNQTSTFFLP